VRNLQILLIRHGESEADLLNVHEGRADYPLTETGRQQVAKMAARVKQEFPPDIIWASTLIRARETAKVLAEEIGCQLIFTDDLREHDNGDIAYRPLDKVEFPFDSKPHEKIGTYGESKIQFRARGEHIFSQIRHESEMYKRVAIVAHGGMISRLIESFLQMPVNHDVFFHTNDTGIHMLEYNKMGRQIRFLNSSTHLD
jgi:2,3-bisphosphoglycerate-dependent phosphoglycerate mutase